MKKCVIIGGAPIEDYERARSFAEGRFAIYCDCGLRHREKLGIEPDLIIGDFDSHRKPETKTEVIVLPREKDDTDSVYALKEALKRGFEDFLLIGAVGARMDHTIANVSLLLMLNKAGKRGKIVDDLSEMELAGREAVRIEDRYRFFSLLSIAGPAKGVSIKNAAYPLENAEIFPDYQYGVSNEVLPGKTAEVSVKEGCLLLIKIKR